MRSYREPPISHGWTIDVTAARKAATTLKDDYHIAAPSIDTQVRLLSGGNLQRLILAREIESKPRLLVAVQPTRGLDVGAIEGVHRLLLARREAGAATLLISEDLDELLALSDRIAVIYEGRIQGVFETRLADVREIGLLMTGGRSSAPIEGPADGPGQPSAIG
jgi:simple sugar transport system ATP-binding protein